MTQTSLTETGTIRFDLSSADGTSIAAWVEGTGPALVLVPGSMTTPPSNHSWPSSSSQDRPAGSQASA
jgi:hypothetical protein